MKLLSTLWAVLALIATTSAVTPSRNTQTLTEADLRAGDAGDGDTPRRDAAPAAKVATTSRPGTAVAATKAKAEKSEETDASGAPKRKAGPTEITAREGLFDQKAHQAIFSLDVLVVNPEFRLTCDKLTAYLRQDGEKAPAANPNKPKPEGAVAAEKAAAEDGTPVPKNNKASGLEKAVAEGSVVITQEKKEADGKITRNVGRSKKAVYESSSGDMTLTGKPEVQTGINSCVALDESTVIILNRDGRMKVFGPHKTVIKDASAPEVSNAR